MNMNARLALGLLVVLAGGGTIGPSEAAAWAPVETQASESVEPSARPPADGSAFPTAVLDHDGALWVTWVEDSHIVVARSVDRGETFGQAVRVTREPESIDANGDARPKIAIGASGEVYVAWTRTGAKPFTGDIRFARSIDGGRTFSLPRVINDDGLATGHRFETIRVNDRGDIFLVWIDKRDQEAALAVGNPYAGAAMYYTWSVDRGETFASNTKIKDHVCECCRLAVEFEDQWPVLVWRDVMEGSIRDHAVLRFLDRDRVSEVGRVWGDNWRIEACPHHGPGFAIDSEGTYHVVWATGAGAQGAGSFYARSADQGRTFSTPMKLDSGTTLAHADAVTVGQRVTLAWKERPSPGEMSIQVRTSDDGGRTWDAPREIARTAGWSDHPLLLSDGSEMFVSWYTIDEGFRLFALPRQDDAD